MENTIKMNKDRLIREYENFRAYDVWSFFFKVKSDLQLKKWTATINDWTKYFIQLKLKNRNERLNFPK